ncbi:hypothetical protein MJ257_09940 [Paenibacillus timonensis]|uniref:Uncharacterized protein n=1 Tax=Paenibacillus timonensis TaxID=225915 RepID=A0ABW3SCN4_9BACL|nr:hypothetical protein [Paenibacillus timonensis]MCH1640426.1 hypothetical protein [Paenibacillus timonensis]
MTQHIQAYFNTEDQLEGARITLQAYNINEVEAGHVSNEWGEDDQLQVPMLPLNNGVISASGPNNPGIVPVPGTVRGVQSVLPVAAMGERYAGDSLIGERSEAVEGERSVTSESLIDTSDEPQGWKYVLSAKVKDSDYEIVVRKLREQGAYIAES